ncbi:flagellar motor switch protein FliN [Thermanaerovibrio acidaminovorans DSM 6589]|uniref:Flagellar motor switch protein FliN n=1 Tax=Thermanaerovibrio acidaminovorans (strain ATCC 49978 / DSM 6589 / Su883) TaxID=525903 RepID=D1B6B2_THEAS|nr:flagellar motor switch protein FliN [Thermanaerovibrio acidaminovorans]ACZ19553.1 flagellar motor switch protein FliN [Thermanaerovibrio acidaminovorans DSM 6589]
MGEDFLSQDEIDALLSGGKPSGGGPSGGGSIGGDEMEILREVASTAASSVGNVMGMLAGRSVSVNVTNCEVAPQNSVVEKVGAMSIFVFSMKWDGLDDAPARLVTSDKGALTLADLMMGGDAKELPEEPNDLYLSASQEGFSQLIGSALTSISGLLKGAKLAPKDTSGGLADFSWVPFDQLAVTDEAWIAGMEVAVDDVAPFPLFLVLPAPNAKDLAERIREVSVPKEEPKQEARAPQAAAAPRAPQPAAPARDEGFYAPRSASISTAPVDVRPAEFAPLGGQEVAISASAIDLISDIPVRITVELGRTRKTIGEILNMSPGSVVELNRMAGEPVDVLVNGKLIARGEVVVIDENFGVRVTEIVSRAERIRSMGV